MKFGISTFLTDESISPAVLGPALEERGFESVFISEHTHIPVLRETPYPRGELPREYYRTLDPFVALTAIASVTERLLVATGIALVVERDPIVTAKAVASLDLVSGGRMIFGMGVGWIREEMRNHGTDPRSRGRLADERMRAMIRLWTEEKAEFHGEFVDFDPVYSWPKPVQRPHPPIYVGGGEGAFARIAEYGTSWLALGGRPDRLADQMGQLRRTARRDVPVTVSGTRPEDLQGYAEAGVERVLFRLPTLPESEALRELDKLAAGISVRP
ncbi:LLM class F420-dependent oxidoreductase [Streptomyces sp. NPDC002574]|uniref:LLM class F420-dependent oxidoreductase n=1 Tax=Streptomyces sp. NPDC002574 TaxID=3364652 RepID=UPI0036B23853